MKKAMLERLALISKELRENLGIHEEAAGALAIKEKMGEAAALGHSDGCNDLSTAQEQLRQARELIKMLLQVEQAPWGPETVRASLHAAKWLIDTNKTASPARATSLMEFMERTGMKLGDVHIEQIGPDVLPQSLLDTLGLEPVEGVPGGFRPRTAPKAEPEAQAEPADAPCGDGSNGLDF